MKFILIFTLSTIANCLSENDNLDLMAGSPFKRIDYEKFKETPVDYFRIKNRENHEGIKYKGEWRYDDFDGKYYDSHEYDDSYEYGSHEYDDSYEHNDDKEHDHSYEDDYYDSYEDERDRSSEEEVSALKKFRKLVHHKPHATISVKLYNISYRVTDGQSGSRKGPVGRFSYFDNLLSVVFPEHFSNDQKRIHLYYIKFSAEGERLFDTKGRYTLKFQSLNKREIINERTNLVTTYPNATLEVEGKRKLRLKFLLGDKQDEIQNYDGSKATFFDPELRITHNSFKYGVQAIAYPKGLSSEKISMIKHQFSKLMSSSNDVEKFIEAHSDQSEYKISVQEITTGAKDDAIFDIFKLHIMETQRDTVQIDLRKAAEALYQHATKDAFLHNHIDPRIPKDSFDNVENTARPLMKKLFQQALIILKDKADSISKGGDIGKIRNSLMESLQWLFQEHRRLTGNYQKFKENESQFGVFKKGIKHKYPVN